MNVRDQISYFLAIVSGYVVRIAPHHLHCIAAVEFAAASDCADLTVLVGLKITRIHYNHVADLWIPAVLLC